MIPEGADTNVHFSSKSISSKYVTFVDMYTSPLNEPSCSRVLLHYVPPLSNRIVTATVAMLRN